MTAGDVTRNHAVYAAASPPTVDVGLFTIVKTGVDLKTNATTDIFTVPSGRTFTCTGAYLVPTTVASGLAVAIVWKIIESGASGVMSTASAANSGAPVTTKIWSQQGTPAGGAIGSPFTLCAAAAKVQLSGTTMWTTSGTVTGSVFVQGFYVS